MFEREFHKGEFIEPSTMLFEDLCKDWERHYGQDAKESSLRARRIALKHITFSRIWSNTVEKNK